ncbi:major capsid protein [bacterium]|nr:major capsid protein [bacterium]
MSINRYQLRTLLAALAQMKAPKAFLLNKFFRTVTVSKTKKVDIDIEKGVRRLAPFVSPLHASKKVERVGYTTKDYEPPMLKPSDIFTEEDAFDRQPGQAIYADPALAQGGAMDDRRLGRLLADFYDQITRREEWMASKALQAGTVPVVGEGVSESIDFGMDANHIITLTGNDLWDSSHADSDPIADLRTWRRLIAKDAGLPLDCTVFGMDAATAFLNHPKVREYFDKLRIDIGTLKTERRAEGIYLGTLPEFGELWAYEDWFIDPSDGSEDPMIPANKVLFGSTMARAERHYGAIYDIDPKTEQEFLFVGERYPRVRVTSNDPPMRQVALWSKPLPAPHQIDGFGCATVLE